MSKYLDVEKLEYNDKIVEIDDDISDTILELNKKGYKTYACCSGHSKVEFYECTVPLTDKEKILKDGYAIIEESDMIYAAFPNISTYCYIKFDNSYNFESIPDGFKYETKEEAYNEYKKYKEQKNIDITFGDSISRLINFFDEDGNRKEKEIIEKEIKEVNKILLNWSKNLKAIIK